MLTRQLIAAGVPAVELHGNLAQNARTRNLRRSPTAPRTTLVATDIAARGIHVDDVALVIHADPPVEHKAYLHRSGRTARAGAEGTVVTLMTDDQVRDVRDLTRKAGIKPTITRSQPGDALLSTIAPGERTFLAVSEAGPGRRLGAVAGQRRRPQRSPWRPAAALGKPEQHRSGGRKPRVTAGAPAERERRRPQRGLVLVRATRPVAPARAPSALALGDLLGGGRQHRVQVADDAEVDELEDRRLLVLVDRDDRLRGLHAGPVLDRAGDAVGDVELRRDGLAGLADLEGVRDPAGVDRGARGADGGTERVGEALDLARSRRRCHGRRRPRSRPR